MSDTLKVLIIEDDPDVRLGCEQALQLEGIATDSVGSAEEAQRRLRKDFRGVIVSDIRLPRMDGMAFLREVQAIDAELPVVLITGHGDVSMAVQAMKDGAYDFIQKPFSPDYLVEVVRRALEKRRLVIEVRDLRYRLEGRDQIEARLIGNAASMGRVRKMIAGLADSAADVLIQGETGTGKELVARCLHEASSRRKGNFVAINCGGLPETLFESEIFGHEAGAYTGAAKRRIGKIEHANGGTLFLDEIESMPLNLQVKLLRVVQERCVERLGSNSAIPVDCRLVAASKSDLKAASAVGQFRSDLYYRLNVVSIDLPPLRQRCADIPLLMAHFLNEAAQRFQRPLVSWTPGDLARWSAHDWPGNVRELKNVAERWALGLPDALSAVALASSGNISLSEQIDAAEKGIIESTLQQCAGNVAQSAEYLQTPKKTLYDKLTRHGIVAEQFRSA